MPAELHELSVAIGKLEKGVETLEQTVRKNQEASTREHREVHNIVVAMSESVRIIAAKVDKMEPLIEDYRDKRSEARGAAKLMNLIYALGGGGVAVAIGKLLETFGGKH